MVARNLTSQKMIVGNLLVADSLLARMKGLLGKSSLQADEGLLITPCKGIHTFGMKFPIDVLFLDDENFVIAVSKRLPPNRLTPIYLKAARVLELPTGTIEATATEIGNQIDIAQ